MSAFFSSLTRPHAHAPRATQAEGEAGEEPFGWPSCLEVLQRAETAHVLGPLLRACPPRRVALRRLAPAADASRDDVAALSEFAAYLAERRRAGIVRLPPAPATSSGQPLPRTLYLIPHGQGVAEALGVREPPPGPALWALVMHG
jgi:hypothetical protein